MTNLEHDVVHTDTDATNGDDVLVGCIMGEYGCWVDTSVTRMIQAGVEHSRVPDARPDPVACKRAWLVVSIDSEVHAS